MAIERMDPRIDEHRVLYTEHVVRYVFAASYAEGKRVLDAGSGAGYGTGILSRAGASSVVGVEIDHETAARARYDYLREGTGFVTADATRLPFPDASFDVVTCFEVIEHINEEQQHALLREMRRVLAPEGILIISTPNREFYTPRVSEQVLGLNPFHLHEFSFTMFSEALAAAFPSVEILGQTPVPPLLLPADGHIGGRGAWYQAIDDAVYTIDPHGGDVAVTGRLADPLAPWTSLYMIGLCGEHPSARRGADASAPLPISHAELIVFALWARWKVFQQELLDWLREKNASLEQTVIERTEWARSLEHDLARATLAVHGLENDLANTHALLSSSEAHARQQAAQAEAYSQQQAAQIDELRAHAARVEAINEQLEHAREALEAQFQRDRADDRAAVERARSEGEAQANETARYIGVLEQTIAQKNQHIAELACRIGEIGAQIPLARRIARRLRAIRRGGT